MLCIHWDLSNQRCIFIAIGCRVSGYVAIKSSTRICIWCQICISWIVCYQWRNILHISFSIASSHPLIIGCAFPFLGELLYFLFLPANVKMTLCSPLNASVMKLYIPSALIELGPDSQPQSPALPLNLDYGFCDIVNDLRFPLNVSD